MKRQLLVSTLKRIVAEDDIIIVDQSPEKTKTSNIVKRKLREGAKSVKQELKNYLEDNSFFLPNILSPHNDRILNRAMELLDGIYNHPIEINKNGDIEVKKILDYKI